MTTNVLIINKQLVFAVTIKQALEKTGAFEVHPFTSADAALDFLRTHPHDVALVDFTLPNISGPDIVRKLRAFQPEIAVIISPTQPNASVLIRELNLQGIIDAPFSARAIIPLIEHAVSQIEQPLKAITRSLMEAKDAAMGDTEILAGDQPEVVEDEPEIRQPPVRPRPSRMASRVQNEDQAERPQTRIPAETKQPESLQDLPQTRQLPEAPPTQTRILSEAQAPEVENLSQTRPLPGQEIPAQTRILSEASELENLPQTRQLPEPEAPAQTRILGEVQQPEVENLPQTRQLPEAPPVQTRNLSDILNTPPMPPDLPEFSSLDSVLTDVAPSEMYEPSATAEDTPSVPAVDSDAVRQYLATKGKSASEAFDNVLEDIRHEEHHPVRKKDATSFDDLVNSMRGEKSHTPLPDRHQQFIDFILTGGMDTLLTEIEKSKTGPLEGDPQPPAPAAPKAKEKEKEKKKEAKSVFDKLAEEEPPMPTLEESGTIGDLMLGVSDTGFRNVLAMMRGDEQEVVDEEQENQQRVAQDIDEAFKSFFDQQKAAAAAPEVEEEELPPPPIKPIKSIDTRDEPTQIPAQLILETALDESTPVDAFSVDDVITNIERQLSEHLPDIQAPPSWGIKLETQSKVDDRFIKEPDFLPEEFPPSERIKTLQPDFVEELPPESPIEAEPITASMIDWQDWDAEAEDAFEDENVRAFGEQMSQLTEELPEPASEVEPITASMMDWQNWATEETYEEVNNFGFPVQSFEEEEQPTSESSAEAEPAASIVDWQNWQAEETYEEQQDYELPQHEYVQDDDDGLPKPSPFAEAEPVTPSETDWQNWQAEETYEEQQDYELPQHEYVQDDDDGLPKPSPFAEAEPVTPSVTDWQDWQAEEDTYEEEDAFELPEQSFEQGEEQPESEAAAGVEPVTASMVDWQNWQAEETYEEADNFELPESSFEQGEEQPAPEPTAEVDFVTASMMDWQPWQTEEMLDDEDLPAPADQTVREMDFGAWNDDFDDATVLGEAWPDIVPATLAETLSEVPSSPDQFDMLIDEAVDEQTSVIQHQDTQPLYVDLNRAENFEPTFEQMDVIEDDPYIAQIALSLTQVSLELTAEETLLTRGSEIVALAGQLSQSDIDELRLTIDDDWDAGPDEARIRFITLQTSGKGYMLYSRKTAGDFTLSMIFKDTTPLRDIRRQGKRLTEALDSVPDAVPMLMTGAPALELDEVVEAPPQVVSAPAPVVEAPPAPVGTLNPYAYVWLLRDANTRFNEATARAIRSGLIMQLREQGWQIKNLEAQGEYIYLVADVPGERPAHEIVRDLKNRAGEIAHAQDSSFVPQSMWADSYLILTPGRELDAEEIDQFIQFERLL